MLKSINGIALTDQWDENEYEKDIKTVLKADYDDSNVDKPVYIELSDIKDNDTVIDSICIALSNEQALWLARSLLKMIPIKWGE